MIPSLGGGLRTLSSHLWIFCNVVATETRRQFYVKRYTFQKKMKTKMKLHNGLMLSLAIIASFFGFLRKGDFANQVTFPYNHFLI